MISGRSRKNPSALALGVTIIELMVVIVLIGILLAWAVPSFTGMIQRNRVATGVNAFVGDLQFARAEAIRQGIPVTLCASDGVSCTGAQWEKGWIVFADPNRTGTRSAGATDKPVLRAQAALKGADTFTASDGRSSLSYSRDGFAIGMPANGQVVFSLHTTPANASAVRCVVVNAVGHQQVLSANGGTCS